MKKNTSSSKGKRRMKKSVRRTFGALSMATAILVAAIPVPETQAYNVDTAAIPEYSVTPATDYKYNDPTAPYPFDTNTDFKSKPKDEIHKAFIMTKVSEGSWQMDWQYEYWVRTLGDNGYITSYNDQYSISNIELASRVYSDYIYITQEDSEKYYKSTDRFVDISLYSGDDVIGVVNDVRSLGHQYILEGELDTKNNPDHQWLLDEFESDVNEYLDKYRAWEAGTLDNAPNRLVKTMADKIKGADRIDYLCKKVLGDDVPTLDLKEVDKRKYLADGTKKWDKVFVPNMGSRPENGVITISGHQYYVDADAYLCNTMATIVGIGANSFKNIGNVSTMKLAKEISFIGDSAFENSFLTSIELSPDTKLGNRAFYNCTKLSSVLIPEGVRSIGAEDFYGCPIASIDIPDSCSYIGPGAFANSKTLSVVNFISRGSTEKKNISKFAFYDDINLSSVSFNSNYITEIGEAAFAVNKVETGKLTNFEFPPNIEKDKFTSGELNIGQYCLAGRENLNYVKLPDNRLSGNLNDTIFYNCKNLGCVEFGDSAFDLSYTSDGDVNNMFYSVANPEFFVKGPKLNAAAQPASPRTSTWKALFNYAATGNTGLPVPYVYTENGKEYYEVSDGDYLMVIEKDSGMLISCTFPQSVAPKVIKDFIIPANVGTTVVTGIKDGCFEGDTTNVGVLNYIENLIVSDGGAIKEIGDNTFKGAKLLKTAYLGDSVETIGKGAFSECGVLNSVEIGERITNIGDEAFQKCSALTDIYFDTPYDTADFPDGNIGENAFNTLGNKLTIHGEISNGYAPFEWATNVKNYANVKQSIRTLYKTPLPTGLSVILDNQNNLATLVGYPHYEDLDKIAYDPVLDTLVELEKAPKAGEDYYGKTILDKIKSNADINTQEENMLKNCLNINIPEGIESIDTQGFFNNNSMNPNNIDSFSNNSSISAYFDKGKEPDASYSKYGLFNGYYGDGHEFDSDGKVREFPDDDILSEELALGNDRVQYITMNDVVYLPDKAFESCEGLLGVSLGGKMEDVGKLPFKGCKNLASVGCGNPKYSFSNGLLIKNETDGSGTIVECLEARGKKVGAVSLSAKNDAEALANVTKIEDEAFSDCKYLISADFTDVDGLKAIPDHCFDGCELLSEVTLPQNVKEIGDGAFNNTGDTTRVIVKAKDMVLGDATKENVKTAYYITYKDAPSKKYAERQGYITDIFLDDMWTVKYFDSTGTNLLYTEFVQDGHNAEGPDESLIPKIPGMEFVGWNAGLKNITEDTFRIAQYKPIEGSDPTITPGVTPGPVPGPVDPTVTPTVTPGPQPNPIPDHVEGKKYRLTVVYGSGSGDYEAGTVVIIEAINPPAGKVFDKWVKVDSSGATITSETSKATTVKTAAADTVITATYKDASSGGSVSRNSSGTSTRNNKNSGTTVQISKPGISNVDKAYASVNGSSDNFIVKITEDPDAANQVATALANKYGDMTPIKYFAMDISLYDANGVNKITNTNGLTVNVTMPIPDALTTYAGNNRVGAVSGGMLEDLPCKFVTVDGIPCVSFTATHFSPYTIYVDTNNLTYGTIDATPKTGDGIHPKWFISIALAALSLILFMKKDRVATSRIVQG